MKKLFIISFLILSVSAYSQQNDTLNFRVGKLLIQARDAESIYNYLRRADVYDDLVDSLEFDFRKPGPKPQGSDIVTVDSVTILALVTLFQDIRQMQYADASPYFTRVDAAIKAASNPNSAVSAYYQKRLTDIETRANTEVTDRRQSGRKRLLGKQ